MPVIDRCIHPDSLASKLVAELGAGWCADVRDVDSVTAALDAALAAWRRGEIGLDAGVREEVLRRFSRRKLAGELAEVLRATIGGDSPRVNMGRAGDTPESQSTMSLASA